MGNVVIDMSMSLDGYIAAPNDTPSKGSARTACACATGCSTIRGVRGGVRQPRRRHGRRDEVMGRRSYDNSIGHGVARSAGRGPVLRGHAQAHRGRGPRVHGRHRRDRAPSRRPRRLRQRRDRTDGCEPRSSSSWPRASWTRCGYLLDVLLGGGRRLFDQLPERTELELTRVSQTGGVTHLEYRVAG